MPDSLQSKRNHSLCKTLFVRANPLLNDADAMVEAMKGIDSGTTIPEVVRLYDQSLKQSAKVFFDFNRDRELNKYLI